MALTRGFIRNAVTTPLDARLMDMATLVCNADGSPRTGVLGGADPSIVSTTGTMNVNVAAAEFAVSKGKADGVAIFTNDGTVAVAIAGAPGSNSRIDVIWVRHQDSTTGDGDSTPIFGVLTGTAAASPVKPGPLPTGAEELATLRVYSDTVATNGGLNVLTNTYRMTAARGGEVSFRTKAELDLWTTAPDGQRAWVADADVHYVRLGATSTWEKLTDSWNAKRSSNLTLTGSTMTSVLQITIAAAPAGRYVIYGLPVTWGSASTLHFRQLKWGATVLPGNSDGLTFGAGVDTPYPIVAQVDHAGGTVVIDLSVQVNTPTCSANQATTLQVEYLGKV